MIDIKDLCLTAAEFLAANKVLNSCGALEAGGLSHNMPRTAIEEIKVLYREFYEMDFVVREYGIEEAVLTNNKEEIKNIRLLMLLIFGEVACL